MPEQQVWSKRNDVSYIDVPLNTCKIANGRHTVRVHMSLSMMSDYCSSNSLEFSSNNVISRCKVSVSPNEERGGMYGSVSANFGIPVKWRVDVLHCSGKSSHGNKYTLIRSAIGTGSFVHWHWDGRDSRGLPVGKENKDTAVCSTSDIDSYYYRITVYHGDKILQQTQPLSQLTENTG